MSKLKKILKFKGLLQLNLTIGEQVLSSAFMFFLGIVLARNLPKDQFGLWVLISSSTLIIYGFHRALINTPYAILYNEVNPAYKRQYQMIAFKMHLVFLFLFILLAILFSTLIEPGLGYLSYILITSYITCYLITQQIKYTFIADIDFYLCR